MRSEHHLRLPTTMPPLHPNNSPLNLRRTGRTLRVPDRSPQHFEGSPLSQGDDTLETYERTTVENYERAAETGSIPSADAETLATTVYSSRRASLADRKVSASESRSSEPEPCTALSMLQGNAPEAPAPSEIRDPRVYLVLGASSFIGRHIVDYLASRGRRVRAMDILQTYDHENVEEFYVGDVRRPSDLDRALDGADMVFHCASLTDPWARPEDYQSVNTRGTANIIQACVKHNVSGLIYNSSVSVVFSKDMDDIQNGTEAACGYPDEYLDEFARSKAEAERLVLAANGRRTRSGVLHTCAIRAHGAFGPRDTSFVANLIARAQRGEITHMIGEGSNIVDFTYIDNIVYAFSLAAEKLGEDSAIAGQVYFITNGEPTLFWEFVSQIMSAVGVPAPRKQISFNVAYAMALLMEYFHWAFSWVSGRKWKPPLTRRMVSQMACHHWFSHEKATQQLGYYPIVSLRDGIQRTLEHFTAEPDARAPKRVRGKSTNATYQECKEDR